MAISSGKASGAIHCRKITMFVSTSPFVLDGLSFIRVCQIIIVYGIAIFSEADRVDEPETLRHRDEIGAVNERFLPLYWYQLTDLAPISGYSENGSLLDPIHYLARSIP